jgi:plasmid stability protein
MPTLNIKNVPDRLYRKIQARAKSNHRSIEEEVIYILTHHVREERRQWD